MNYLVLFLSILPSILLGQYIYNKDKVEKEPGSLLIKLFLLGIVAVIITLALSLSLGEIFPILNAEREDGYFKLFISTYIGVGVIEEGSKWLMLRLATWKNKNFTHIFDALVYAAFISLGFATVENVLYVINGGLTVAILRAILSVPGHFFFSIFMGYYYGLAKQADVVNNYKFKNKNMFLSFLVPVLVHGTFDYSLLTENYILILFYFIFVIFLYIKSFKTIKQFSRVTKSLKDKVCSRCGTFSDGNFCPKCGNKL